MWERADVAAEAAPEEASTTLATPGMTACANAATRIQIRSADEKRPAIAVMFSKRPEPERIRI
jgi:hypothetical protein